MLGQRDMQMSSRVPLRRAGRSTAAVPVASAAGEHATKAEPLRISSPDDSGNILIKDIESTSALLEIATDPYCASDDAHHYQVRNPSL